MSECNDTYVEMGGPDAILVAVPQKTQVVGEEVLGLLWLWKRIAFRAAKPLTFCTHMRLQKLVQYSEKIR